MADSLASCYRSFLLRLWREQEGAASGPWQGEVEYIQGGRKWAFATLDELLAFLQRQAGDPALLNDDISCP